MRDVFYTLLILWVVMQIYKSFKSSPRKPQAPPQKRPGDVTVENPQHKSTSKDDGRGDYVDYEEVKD